MSRASADVLFRLESASRAGKLYNMLGHAISVAPTEGLVSKDMNWFYIMANGIPCLLPDEAISLESLAEDLNDRA